MQNKKLASIIALTAVVANLGVASLAFAQSETTEGTQPINCEALSSVFATRVPVPADFAFAARQVSNNYDNYTSASYFGGDTGDLVDSLAIESNTPVACANETRSVQLDVQAETPFYSDEDSSNDFNAGDYVLSNVGADDTFETEDDIAAILSISTDAVSCGSGCTLAGGTLGSNGAKNGTVNYFDGTANDGSTDAGYNSAVALLTPGDNYDQIMTDLIDPSPVTLFTAPMGYDGEIQVNNVSFGIALPANIEVPTVSVGGVNYTTNVIYTIS